MKADFYISPQHRKDVDLLEWVQRRAQRSEGWNTPLLLLWRQAERAGVVQLGEEKAPRRAPCSLTVLEGNLQKRRQSKFLKGQIVAE